MAHSNATRVLVFGDQTYDFVPKLRELFQVKDNPILTAFLEQSHYVVRAQMIQSLPPAEHKAARTFDLADMLKKYVAGKLSPAFQTALSCITQLGVFMREFHDFTKPYPRHDSSYVLGICTGSLAAAAVSSSSSLSELLPIAVQTALIAFRLGLCVTDMRDRLESATEDRTQPWSVVLFDTNEQTAVQAIKDFCASNVLPKTKQPWITSASSKTTTVSGAPRILKKLVQEPALKDKKTRNIPIYVPAHNPALFTPEDVKSILETTPVDTWSNYPAKLPFISSVSGKLAWADNYLAVIQLALNQCLLESIGWGHVETELPRLLKFRGAQNVLITPITTSTDRALSAALGSTIANIEVEKASTGEAYAHRPGSGKSKLAIVSMSGRFPEAQSTDSFWDLLYKGLDVVKEVPKRRWDVTTHVDPTGRARNKGATKWGCWLDFAGEFDPRFFSISPKEAPQMDPAQRMALMSTYEAMERGGIVPDTTPSTQRNRIGVFHGVTSNDWMETNTAQNIDTYFITGGNRGFIPGRINFCFEFSGPSYTNDTACSSSLAAIHLACNSLWHGDCDTAVAGGTNMIFTPDGHAGLDKGFFLSRTGNCKPFDDKADGYCRAEGVGTVMIKRLEDALADGDPIIGTILDAKTNHSAMSDSMTRPFVPAQIDNMEACLSTAGVDATSLDYIEMHGTGTQVGDAVEMESVLSVFAPNEQLRTKEQPLYVGSAKANIGHGEGVSGVTSLIKVLLMFQNNTIPPHCGIKPGSRINHNYPDLAARNVHIAFEPKPFLRREGRARRVLINNFSAAGGNTALLIEDSPDRMPVQTQDPRTAHTVTVSGHVGKSLSNNLSLLLTHLKKNPTASLPHLSYTTTARRWHHLHRVAVSGTSIADITAKLEKAVENKDGVNRPKAKPSVFFAFTGQGSQYLGMGRQLYDSYPKFRAELQRYDRLAQSHGFPSFAHIFTTASGDVEQNLPIVVQLAITALQMALFNLLTSFGLKASAVVGHSLGEYAALYAAGVLSASDTIYLVGKRAELLQERCQRGTHSMLACKASEWSLAEVTAGTDVEVACVNGPEDTVLSGTVEEVAGVQQVLSQKGVKATMLKLPFAFHSAQVQPILEDFEHLASGATFEKPKLAVLSPLLGSVVEKEGVVGPAYLARHCREAVRMVKALETAKEKGTISEKTIVIEIGPKPLLCGMIKNILGQSVTALPTLKDKGPDVWTNLSTIFTTLYTGGLDVNWTAVHAPFEAAKTVIQLPDYGWDLKDYFIQYEGDWVLHRHKIHCNCADEGKDVHDTSHYCPGKHTFVENVVVPGGAQAQKAIAAAPSDKPAKKMSKLDPTKEAYPGIPITTTVHKVIEEKTEPLGAHFTVETDISRPDVNSIAQGHTVDDIPLCTPSFYADIALQVGKYAMDRIRAGHPGAGAIDGRVDVTDLVVDKALIPHGKAPQLLRTTVTMSWPPKMAATTRSAKVTFKTYTADGKLDTDHAYCTVRFTTDAQQKSLQKKVPEYKAAIESLRARMKKGELVHYNTKSGYKLMSSMAHFHPDYKLLNNLILNEAENEAVSVMNFSTCTDAGTYAAHPAYVDAITQVGGFAMNAKDDTDIDKEVYVNHGWESFQVYKPLVKEKQYVVYSKMAKDPKGDLVHGDTIVLDGDEVVAFFRGLSLRSVPRKALRAVLQSAMDKGIRQRGGKPGAAKGAAAMPVAKAKPAPVVAPKASPVAAVPSTPKPAPPPAPKPAALKVVVKADNGKVDEALKIISEESGIALDELTDDSNFTVRPAQPNIETDDTNTSQDMGVDSLSSMVITSRLREDLELYLAPDFALFADCPIVASLREFLGGSAGASSAAEEFGEPTPVAETAPEPVPAPAPAPMQAAPKTVAPPKPVITTPAAPVSSKVFDDALQIVSEESGIALDELTDDSNFTDMGVDSLSSMVITSRLREDLELELEPEWALFADCPTVASLRDFLRGSAAAVPANQDTPVDTTATEIEAPVPTEAPAYIPDASQGEVDEAVREVLGDDPPYRPATQQPSTASLAANTEALDAALRIIAEESGVAAEDFADDTIFSDSGIDSLCSMVISSRFREELELDLDSQFSLFVDLPTVAQLREYVTGPSSSADSDNSSVTSAPADIATPPHSDSGHSSDTEPDDEPTPTLKSDLTLTDTCRATNSVILQGMPRIASKILFLLPDGGGSASSYSIIPKLRSDVAVVGINCPYARDPENMTCTHQAMMRSFVNEIKRRQPKGPYHLGGWSSGGAFAYVTAETLINQGEEVASLFIFDAPVPQVMEKLPREFYEAVNFTESTVVGTVEPPPYLIPHFMAVVDVMLDYKCHPLKTKKMPKVGLIWADSTVMKEEEAPKMKGMHFMIQKRTDFGPDGWDKVCPGAKFDLVKAEDTNHFTLMTKARVYLVSELIERVMG